ncbi:Ger(x)C family spore germination protein [Paenibacillus mendelii]|uniref:Ger(X)C family spore germination protein n=1 Tax=Paenibacillus mendelii TaxID=206163 RepID=A0ABV6J1T3_9BACL|nr:Ger(x)C family spore germination protein [Paenibacillus mendelii]MCQ6562761.1 Ger(x)C family spore germination protein [Paenibacillus mendelii]
MKPFIVVLLMVTLLTSCIAKTEVIEDIYMALAMAVDFKPTHDDEASLDRSRKGIDLTLSVPLYTADHKVESISFKESGITLKETISSINHKSDQYLSISKLGAVLFSENVLRSGIGEYAETLNADPLISGRLILAMTEGRAEHILQGDFRTNNQPVGRYLCNIVENNFKTFDLPRMNLHQFIYEWKGIGMDPVMPIIEISEKKATLAGIAILKDDSYMGKLTVEEIVPFTWMKKNTRNGSYVVRLPEQNTTIQDSTTRVRYKYLPNHNQFNIYIRVEGKLTKSDLSKSIELSEVRNAINKQFTNQCETVIAKLQKWGTDPLGLGNVVRSRVRNWDERIWKEQYPSLNIKIIVDSTIRR